jgi:hypothetical protein
MGIGGKDDAGVKLAANLYLVTRLMTPSWRGQAPLYLTFLEINLMHNGCTDENTVH